MKLLEWNLSPGEYICTKCCGQGQMNESEKIAIQTVFKVVMKKTIESSACTCTVCHGTGKLDWIEYARGQKGEPFPAIHLLGWSRNQTAFHIGFEWTSFFITPLMKNIYTRMGRQKRRRIKGETS